MESIAQIKKKLEETSLKDLFYTIDQYKTDERKGVQKLLLQYEKKWNSYQKELERISQMWMFERQHPDCTAICGIDEAGRGPLAGPVVAAAVILPSNCDLFYVNDSKQLSAKKRELLFEEIQKKAVSVGVGIVSAERIDEINILQATYEAMRMAVSNLCITPDLLLNDAVTIPQIPIHQIPIIKGDAKSISIAAASIIAKVTRDRMMLDYHELFPEYDFASNKGYGSAAHIQSLKQLGPCPIHRRTFIKNFCEI
ncbi:MAG: ribonuclease HII [Clostridiales bacterium]|nr:ribonuclease HII [Clostridiales bacterium]